ncbi:hypothetical protein RRSWK_03221 [Rhodopirellula sp. SWK7]|nr:hypothetical protein RRSWK_03221 [Rhodopirellula sp. SWK7]
MVEFDDLPHAGLGLTARVWAALDCGWRESAVSAFVIFVSV